MWIFCGFKFYILPPYKSPLYTTSSCGSSCNNVTFTGLFYKSLELLYDFTVSAMASNKVSDQQLYLCEHCNKYISFKTYTRHRKQYLGEKDLISAQLPSSSSDSEMEPGIFMLICD